VLQPVFSYGMATESVISEVLLDPHKPTEVPLERAGRVYTA